jgi:hypothetical protein
MPTLADSKASKQHNPPPWLGVLMTAPSIMAAAACVFIYLGPRTDPPPAFAVLERMAPALFIYSPFFTLYAFITLIAIIRNRRHSPCILKIELTITIATLVILLPVSVMVLWIVTHGGFSRR